MDAAVLLDFIKATQPKEWNYIYNIQGDKAAETLLDDLCRALNSEHQGCLDVLRHGFKCFGKTFHIAYFAPASGLNPDTKALYEANKLTVTRQLKYSMANENSIDLVLSLNGIPIITAELKNPMTGQTWRQAVKQYKFNRDPRELIFQFKKRSLVHFAVDPDEVYMTTKLAKGGTYFLPFNKGDKGGCGNPVNPNGYKTAYIWEQVWQKDSLLDILSRFMHLEVSEKTLGGKKIKKERMIFPRYHQLQAVRQLVTAAEDEGPGHNYLIQHSAGSGKSNSIAWLAHRLATLYSVGDEKVFDSVIVVTDRLVLDQQLQNTIYQFEHKHGVVEKIDTDSTKLANALAGGVPIIITTLQKFPFVAEKVGELPKRNYALIVDEAHSSQGGQSAAEMKRVLAGEGINTKAAALAEGESLPDYEEEVNKTIAARGKQNNLSFFAFTATPKYKTLEVFGRPSADGKPVPFHLYTMRQAIEEGFILDVLQHYTTYKTYFGLIKSVEDDPELDKKKAARALARFMSLHPHNVAQKTEVMVEHFRTFTRHKIGGKAKAMVVTASRLHAVKYKLAFDKYIAEKGYDIRTLVAFSGDVIDPDVPGVEYREVSMNNGIKEKELPEKFANGEYQVLLVAEKYQTGFDQPLLHTMYVDKRLAGIQAVQTLSRLNRTHPGKEDTFVLDFVNDPEDILEAFKPYYEATLIGERAEPGQLYQLKARLDAAGVYHWSEVDEFARTFYKPKNAQQPSDHQRLNACLDTAVKRFSELEETEREELRGVFVAYRNLYAFLAQIIPFGDSELEKLYSYIRFLLTKLPKRDIGSPLDLEGEVALKYYRLEKTAEDISIELGSDGVVDGPTEVGTGVSEKQSVYLSQLIDILNERFGTNFASGDQLFFDSIKEDIKADEKIRQAATVNTLENFGFAFNKVLENFIINRMEQNEDMVARFFNDKEFQVFFTKHLQEDVYNEIRKETS